MLQKSVKIKPDLEPSQLSLKPLHRFIADILDDHKALDIVTVDLKDKSDMADFLVIATGNSRRHVKALADHLQEQLKTHKVPLLSVEGTEECDWVLVDFGDVVVHLFVEQARTIYNLEQMWSTLKG